MSDDDDFMCDSEDENAFDSPDDTGDVRLPASRRLLCAVHVAARLVVS